MTWRGFKSLVICWGGFFIFRLLMSTYRIRFHQLENQKKAKALHPSGSFVYGLWHENFFAAVATHPFQRVAPMISQSKDGNLISFIAEKLGFEPVRGSTSRGGESARIELYERVERGLAAAFTADGPKGPRRKMKSGLIDLSRQAQMAILPLAIAADRAWIFKRSWDQSLIPKPFSRVEVFYGDPLVVPSDAHGLKFAQEKLRVQLALNQLCDKASQFVQNR